MVGRGRRVQGKKGSKPKPENQHEVFGTRLNELQHISELWTISTDVRGPRIDACEMQNQRCGVGRLAPMV